MCRAQNLMSFCHIIVDNFPTTNTDDIETGSGKWMTIFCSNSELCRQNRWIWNLVQAFCVEEASVRCPVLIDICCPSWNVQCLVWQIVRLNLHICLLHVAHALCPTWLVQHQYLKLYIYSGKVHIIAHFPADLVRVMQKWMNREVSYAIWNWPIHMWHSCWHSPNSLGTVERKEHKR